MQSNNHDNHQYKSNDDRINDLRKLISLLFDSRKFIVLTSLIFMGVALIFDLKQPQEFISSAVIEIGKIQKPLKIDEYLRVEEPIQDIENLIQKLKVDFIHKPNVIAKKQIEKRDKFWGKQSKLTFEKIENSLLKITTSSISPSSGSEVINTIVSSTKEKHRKIIKNVTESYAESRNEEIQKLSKEINNKIDSLNKKARYKLLTFKSQASENLEEFIYKRKVTEVNIENIIKESQRMLRNLYSSNIFLDREINLLNEVISKSEEDIELLQQNQDYLFERLSIFPSPQSLLFDYKNELNLKQEGKNENFENIVLLEKFLLDIDNNIYGSNESYDLNLIYQEKIQYEKYEKQIEKELGFVILLLETLDSGVELELDSVMETTITSIKGIDNNLFELLLERSLYQTELDNYKLQILEKSKEYLLNLPNNTHLLGEVITVKTPNNHVIVLLGLLLGFLLSISLVILRDKLKSSA